MNVLLLGSGGREHAIALCLQRSERLKRLFVMPGNAGTAQCATNTSGDPANIDAVCEVVRREAIDLVVIGPEDPLAAGVADALDAQGTLVFGPCRAGAKLESDKAFAKQLMRAQSIPTAEARVFTDFKRAREYIATRDYGLVVKAAGLAKGKGVIVCPDPSDAILAAEKMLIRDAFGSAGSTIVVEELLTGREASVFALIDGHTIYVLETAQDYKRLGDNDTGPNTGGMGAISPAPQLDDATLSMISTDVIAPTLDALFRDGVTFRGVLYVGLMLTAGGPKVLEFNTRFGDPEAQALLPRVRSDFLDVLELTARGQLDQASIEWDPRPSVNVVLASPGYPDKPDIGAEIGGLDDQCDDHVTIFHAGTQRNKAGRIVSNGGRVLSVTALGATLDDARRDAYARLDSISLDRGQMRRDIGLLESTSPSEKQP